MAVTLPPPIQDHLIELLAHGFHVGIGKAGVQRAHTVRVRTRAADGVVELDLADFLLTENSILVAGLAILTYPDEVDEDPRIKPYAA